MNIDIFVLKLFIIFIPGIISLILIKYLSITKNINAFFFTLYSLFLGIINYFILEFIYHLFKNIYYLICALAPTKFGSNLSIWEFFYKTEVQIELLEIFAASIISFFLGAIITLFIQNKYILRLFEKLEITKKIGDDDVWSRFLNSKEIDWVYIRDLKYNLTYFGKIQSFSDMNQSREIVLSDVSMYNLKDGELLYGVPTAYIPISHNEFRIELAK